MQTWVRAAEDAALAVEDEGDDHSLSDNSGNSPTRAD